MELTVIGCSGSVPGPHSVASSYLVQIPGANPIVLDMGPGSVGVLQNYVDPGTVTVLLSHLHADHCLDIPSWLVWRRFSPNAAQYTQRALTYAPAGAAERLGRASAENPALVDDISDTLDVRTWDPGAAVTLDDTTGAVAATVTVTEVLHPPLSYGIRVDTPDGAALTYSGDTAYCEQLVSLATGSDVLLCEASWEHPGTHPESIHMSGTEAGRVATRAGVGMLVLTHIPPWTRREAVLAEARAEFAGEILLAEPGLRVPITR